jgi:hypothetical protein
MAPFAVWTAGPAVVATDAISLANEDQHEQTQSQRNPVDDEDQRAGPLQVAQQTPDGDEPGQRRGRGASP